MLAADCPPADVILSNGHIITSVECPENLDLGLFTEQTCYMLSG